MNQFEQYETSLTEEQVINYLLSWQRRGFKIVHGRQIVRNGWSVEFGGNKWIGIQPDQSAKGCWRISYSYGIDRRLFGTFEELKTAFEDFVSSMGIRIDSPPKEHHTSSDEPFSVWIKLNSMIASSVVEAIYDPFIGNKALENLIGLASFGAKFNPKLRILTSHESGIKQNFLDKFNKELGISAEIQKTEENEIRASYGRDKHHVRLIFAGDGRCLSPDFSLSDEQVGTIKEIECAPKLAIFEDAWGKGIPL